MSRSRGGRFRSPGWQPGPRTMKDELTPRLHYRSREIEQVVSDVQLARRELVANAATFTYEQLEHRERVIRDRLALLAEIDRPTAVRLGWRAAR